MTRYLLDTNIISNIVKPTPSETLLAWMDDQPDQNLFISALTIAELRRGILELPGGRRRQGLESWFNGPEGPQSLFAGRVLVFDERAALLWGKLMAEGTVRGRPRSALDMILAATAEAHGCIIATDNERHFIGLKVINPMRS